MSLPQSNEPSAAVSNAFAQAVFTLNQGREDTDGKLSAEAITSIYKSTYAQTNYFGERVSQITHAEQAAFFATQDGADEDTILASLLHDTGHIIPIPVPQLDSLGTQYHEVIGAQLLDVLKFPFKVCKLVEQHVTAKRYLCWKNPEYFSTLSPSSVGTLKLQGGVMNDKEGVEFENEPLYKTSIAMRVWDEKAKIPPPFPVPSFDSYKPMMERAVRRRMAIESYLKDGYILLKNLLTPEQKRSLVSWVDEIQNWPPTAGKWMVYYETVKEVETLCRTENFLPYHDDLRSLLSSGELVQIISALFNSEEACIFKEKINYKLAGGAGFPAHQDAPAFTHFGQKVHLTLNIAIDPATPENGCLEISPGHHVNGLYPQDPVHNGLSKESESRIPWVPVPMDAGDVLLFSSYLPHRSGPNTTTKSRRALYVTYNAKADGDFRETYYVDKRKHFPQKIERIPGKDYSEGAKIYNLATPISS